MRLEHLAVYIRREHNLFQFHKGAIRTPNQLCMREGLHHFNSIKVRLEQDISLFLTFANEFQFHKGAIRTDMPAQYFQNLGISIP